MSEIKPWRDRVPKETTSFDYPRVCRETADAEIAELRAALAKVEQGEPVAWVRCHPDGTLTDELMPNSIIEVVRKYSGAWVPLFARPVCPMSDEPVLGTKTWMEGGVVMTQNLTASDIYKPAPMTEDEFITAITAACASFIEDQKPAALKLKT